MSPCGGKLPKRKAPQTVPISLRLTESERTRLERDAQGQAVSAYIRKKLFGAEARATEARAPTSNARQFAHILAALGQSGIAGSLRELSEAARVGVLPVGAETDQAIQSACDVVVKLRSDLIAALGLREGADQ